jgi:transposase-like protein
MKFLTSHKRLSRAIKEILETDISIRKAAQKYSLSKTNLWFHFKHYKETHDTTGGNLRQNKKPNRTLQKIKKNLQAQQTQSTTTIETLRQKAVLFKEQLQNAISDCKNGASLTEVSAKYNIPEETIYRNVKNMNLPHIMVAEIEVANREDFGSESVVEVGPDGQQWWPDADN